MRGRARWIRDCSAMEKVAVKCEWEGRVVTVLVEAAVRGPLAIHPTQGAGLPPWTVTHVATGYAVWRFFFEGDAENFVRTILPLDWNFETASMLPQATSVAVALLLRSLRP